MVFGNWCKLHFSYSRTVYPSCISQLLRATKCRLVAGGTEQLSKTYLVFGMMYLVFGISWISQSDQVPAGCRRNWAALHNLLLLSPAGWGWTLLTEASLLLLQGNIFLQLAEVSQSSAFSSQRPHFYSFPDLAWCISQMLSHVYQWTGRPHSYYCKATCICQIPKAHFPDLARCISQI